MKIAIEAQRIFRVDKHGMDMVILESLKQLQKLDHENEYYVLVKSGKDRCLKETDNMHIVEINCPTYPLWEQFALPRVVNKIAPDLLHCTSNTAPLFCKTPLILTLHDIIFLEKRQSSSKSWYQEMGWYYRRLVVPRILKKCKMIITVSEFECNRIRETLKLSSNTITSIYNGFNDYFKPIDANPTIVKKYIDTMDFFLFLGNTDPKKNAIRVLIAFSKYIRNSKKKRKLLIADLKESFIDSLLVDNNIEEIKSYLVFPGYVVNKDLIHLYNAAYLFLYPSLRESFGIPQLEAMACGTPIITGNTSAMPEIAGEDAVLVNPINVDEIAKAMLRLEEDNDYYNNQKQYGLERVKKFSWENTAKDLLKLYKKMSLK